jgi:hypothetical protein
MPRIGTRTPRSVLQISTSRTREGHAEDLQDGDADRWCDETACTPPGGLAPCRHAVHGDEHHHHDPAGCRGEVGVGDVVHDLVLDGQGAPVAEDRQHHALPAEQAAEGDDEGWQPEPGDQGSVEQPYRRADHERGEDRRPPGPAAVRGGEQLGCDDTRDAGDEAGREVDLAEEQREDLRHRQHHEDRALHQQVDDVARRQEVGIQRLEDDRDDEHPDDDREHAALAGAQPGDPDVQVVTERAGGDSGWHRDLGGRFGKTRLVVMGCGLIVGRRGLLVEVRHGQPAGRANVPAAAGGRPTRPNVM